MLIATDYSRTIPVRATTSVPCSFRWQQTRAASPNFSTEVFLMKLQMSVIIFTKTTILTDESSDKILNVDIGID